MRRKNASLVCLASPPSRGRPRRNPRRRLPPALPLPSPLPPPASAAGQSPCGASGGGIFLTRRWSLSRGMLLVAVRPGARTSSTGGGVASADGAGCPRAARLWYLFLAGRRGFGRCWPAREWRCGGGAAGGDLRQGMAVGLEVMAVVGRHIDADGRRRWPWRSSVAAG
jgi:hypothetical protein